jgi:hypothetical protein
MPAVINEGKYPPSLTLPLKGGKNKWPRSSSLPSLTRQSILSRRIRGIAAWMRGSSPLHDGHSGSRAQRGCPEFITRFATMDSGLARLRPRPGMTKLCGPLGLARLSPRKRGPSNRRAGFRFCGNERMRSAGSRIYFVIAGLDPAIYAGSPHSRVCLMDARIKPTQ